MKLDNKVTILGIIAIMIVGLCWPPSIFAMKNAKDQVSAPFISLYYPYKDEIKRPVQEAFYVKTKINNYNAYQVTQCLYGEEIEVMELNQKEICIISKYHDSSGIIPLITKNKNICPLTAYSLNKLGTKMPALVCAATAQTFYNSNEPATIIPMGCELHVEESFDENYFQFFDPRGFSLLIAKKDVVLIEELNQLNQKDFRPRVIDQACKLIDYPYQWGGQCGCEGSGFDCAGLVHTVYRSCGINIKRGVRDQFDRSNQLASPSRVQPSDLIFFYCGRCDT